MKNLLLLCSILTSSIVFSQKTVDVKLKIVYNNNPLCNWEVTLKHGDVAIGKGTTDKNGMVEFNSVTILSKSVDAYGYKPHKGGDKKWDAKGYITLNDDNYGVLDFGPIVKDAGMPVSMMENAWGLTINDCGQVGQSTTSPAKTEEVKPTTIETAPTTTTTNESTTLSPLENLQNQKVGHENKLANLDKRIEKKKAERTKFSDSSKEYSTLSYEIRDLEIEKDITQIKLERTEKLIAKGGTSFLTKEERQGFDSREDKLVAEQKELKQKEKSGIPFGGSAPVVTPSESPIENKEEDKEEDAKKKSFDSAELAAMSTANLKKIKLENNSAITKRKMTLKTRSNFLTPQEKADLQLEIDDLLKQIELIDAELEKRSESEN